MKNEVERMKALYDKATLTFEEERRLYRFFGRRGSRTKRGSR